MSELNIQHLFRSISLNQIRKYLSGLGWKEKETEVRWQFEKLDPETQSTRVLILPRQESHPKFRSMVPNIVFSLAVEHQREAMEIAIELSKIQIAETSASPAINTPHTTDTKEPRKPLQLELANTGTSTVQLGLNGEAPIDIAPSEAIFVSLSPGDQPLRLETKSDLTISTSDNTVLSKSFGFPSRMPALDNIDQVTDFILGTFQRWHGPSQEVDLRAELSRLTDRYLFSIDGLGSQLTDRNGIMRSLAVLLVSISKKLEPSQETTATMFEVCRILLRPFHYTFSMTPLLPDQLWVTLREDDAEAPRRSLLFLQQHVIHWYTAVANQ